ncbi:hypothetical protein [Streptomyces sp. NPDC001135]
MASQAELLVAGGDPRAPVLVVPESVLAPSPFSALSALVSFTPAGRLALPASPPAPASAGHGRAGDL